MFPTDDIAWSIALNGVTDADIENYLSDQNLTPNDLSDAQTKADVTTALQKATASGNTKLENTLKFVLKYGDAALSILTKNGIIANKNLTQTGTTSTDTTDTTSGAPDASNRLFNLDFTSPKVLIISGLLLIGLIYFLFFNKGKNRKKR